MGGELVGFSQTSVGKETVKRRLEYPCTCTTQLLTGHVPGSQRVHPTSIELVVCTQMLIDADEVLVSLVGLDLRGQPRDDTARRRQRLARCRRNPENRGRTSPPSYSDCSRSPTAGRREFTDERCRLACCETRSFVVSKEKSLVLDDRAAYRTAELILMERRLLVRVKEVPGIQSRISSV